MNLRRRMQRQNLKTQIKQYEQVVRDGSKENKKINSEIDYYKNKIHYLQLELNMARDIINALALADIRNNNYTSDMSRDYVALPFSYLTEVSYCYTLNMKSDKDVLVIEPTKNVKQEEGTKDANEEGKNADGEGTDTEASQEKH